MGLEAREGAERRARCRGCLAGLAVGDAFGAPVEFMSRDEILTRFPPTGISDLEPWGDFAAGSYTDDTQMSIATARGVLDWRAATARRSPAAGSEPDLEALRLAIWRRYLGWHQSNDWQGRAPGDTCMSALASGIPGDARDAARNGSKGCGGVMRVAPLGLVDLGIAAFEAGANAAALTHGSTTSDSASGFQALLIDRLVRGTSLDEAVAETRDVLVGRAGASETLAAVDAAMAFAASTEEPYAAIGRIGSDGREAPGGKGKGWVADEALGIGLFAALRFRDDFAAALHAAATINGDSDSTASIAGAIIGASRGLDAVPSRWLDRVENKDELLSLADALCDQAT